MMIQSALRGADHAHFNRRLRERWLALREEIRSTLLRADVESYADIAGEVHDLEDESLADLLTDVSHAQVTREAACKPRDRRSRAPQACDRSSVGCWLRIEPATSAI